MKLGHTCSFGFAFGCSGLSTILAAHQSLTLGSGCFKSVFTLSTASPSFSVCETICSKSAICALGSFSLHGHAFFESMHLFQSSLSHVHTYALPISMSFLMYDLYKSSLSDAKCTSPILMPNHSRSVRNSLSGCSIGFLTLGSVSSN